MADPTQPKVSEAVERLKALAASERASARRAHPRDEPAQDKALRRSQVTVRYDDLRALLADREARKAVMAELIDHFPTGLNFPALARARALQQQEPTNGE